jgi:hypothetical protein
MFNTWQSESIGILFVMIDWMVEFSFVSEEYLVAPLKYKMEHFEVLIFPDVKLNLSV